ncbi:hypothetical protein PC111_g9617 [Phytophthora cactorum]|nr:hypothetical protein PC111_g9617 [Phytophthora cactorum]
MVFGNEYEDEGDERNFGRAEERDDGEQPVSVPAAVERLERVARARVSRDPLSVVEQAPVSDEGAAEPQGVATTGINLESDVWRELFVDEAKETEEEEKGRSATGVTVKTEVREEPEVKREVVVGVLTCSGDPHATDGYDSEYYIAHEAYDSAYEAEHEEDDVVTSERSRSGFISRYTGPEVRRSDRPAFGWSWGAQSEEGAFGAFRSGQGTRTVSKAAMLLNLVSRSRPSSVSFTAVTSAASTAPGRPALKVSSTLATGASAVTQGGSSMSRRATAAPVGSRQSVASPRRVVKTADPFQLSQLVSNAVKLLPMFYSDSATSRRGRMSRDRNASFADSTSVECGPTYESTGPSTMTGGRRREKEEEEGEGGEATPSSGLGIGTSDGGGETLREKPVAVSVEDIKGTDKKKSEVKTVVEATVASEEVVIAEREKTDVDAELSVAEKKVAVVGDVKEVVRSVEAAEEVGAVCEVSRTVGEAPVEDEKEVFWDAVETKVNMINKHKSKDEGVSFPRIRFAPRLFAAPPLKFALKKLELGQEEGSEEAPEVLVFSDGEVDVSVGQVDPASRGEATEDSRTVNDAPECKYSRLFTDAELDAIEACDPGDEGTVLTEVEVSVEKEEVTERPSGATTSEPVTPPVDSPENVTGLDEATLERVMCEDVVLPLQEEDVVATASEVLPRPAFGRKAIQKEKVRGVAHEAVYRMLKEAAMSQGGTDGAVVPRSSDVECVGVPPLRDKDQAEAIGDVVLCPKCDEDASHYVEVVHLERPPPDPPPNPDLMNVTGELTDGFGIHILTAYLRKCFADTGAMLSLIDRRFLKRLGRYSEPFEGRVNSSSGHRLRVRGWISLPVCLAEKEVPVKMIVADKLHVDAILGVDALGAFGAVIDVTERTWT